MAEPRGFLYSSWPGHAPSRVAEPQRRMAGTWPSHASLSIARRQPRGRATLQAAWQSHSGAWQRHVAEPRFLKYSYRRQPRGRATLQAAWQSHSGAWQRHVAEPRSLAKVATATASWQSHGSCYIQRGKARCVAEPPRQHRGRATKLLYTQHAPRQTPRAWRSRGDGLVAEPHIHIYIYIYTYIYIYIYIY